MHHPAPRQNITRMQLHPASNSMVDAIIAESQSDLQQVEAGVVNVTRMEDPRVQISRLDDEITRVEKVLSRLKAMQPPLRRDINQRYCPMHKILPPEIVAEIFIHCIPDLGSLAPLSETEKSMSPLFLGAICTFWRHIAWTTPFLWTSPRLLLSNPKLIQMQAELLEEWISRSGNLPLTLRLHFVAEDDRLTGIPDNVFKVILRNSRRWRGIDLQIPTAYYENLTPREGGFDSLRELIINPSGGQGDRSHRLNWAGCTPQLSEIRLYSVYLNTLLLRWDSITHVHAKSFYVDECLEFMQRTPRLEHCFFHNIIHGDDNHGTPEEPFLLPKLQTLSLLTERAVDASIILSKIVAPSLKALTYDDHDAERSFQARHFISFLTRSRCNLERLEIMRWNATEESVLSLLSLIPTVVDFRINLSDNSSISLDPRVIAALRPTGTGECLLPNMTRFEYTGPRSFSWDSMIGMLLARRGLNLSSIAGVPTDGTHILYGSEKVSLLLAASLRLSHCPSHLPRLDETLREPLRRLIDTGLDLCLFGPEEDFMVTAPLPDAPPVDKAPSAT